MRNRQTLLIKFQKILLNPKKGFKNGKFLFQKENRICCLKSAVEKSQKKNGKAQLKAIKNKN